MCIEIWKPVVGYEGLYEVSNKGKVRSLEYRGHKGFVSILDPKPNKKGYRVIYLYKKGEKRHGYNCGKLVGMAFPEICGEYQEGLEIDHIIPLKNGGTDCAENLRWVTHGENMNNPLSKENASVASKNADHSKLKGRKAWNKGISHTQETREKISKAQIGRVPWNKGMKKEKPPKPKKERVVLRGESHPMFGKHHTEEARKKISERFKGCERKEREKPILQLDINGGFVCRWLSASDAEKEKGYSHTNINAVLRGRRKTAYGFKWVYA